MNRGLSIFSAALLVLGLLTFVTQPNLRADDAGKWGSLKGQIIFGGDKLLAAEPLKVDKDQAHCLSKGPILSETWVVNSKNKGVKDVFIWLEPTGDVPLPIHPKLKEPKEPKVVIDQPCCKFIPHVACLREGQILVANNSSPIQHNFKWGGHPEKNPGGNINLPPGAKFDIKGLQADKYPVLIECNVHPWMRGYVRVFDHPYYTTTDENGNFTLPLAPVGEYRIKIWHPGSGWRGGAAGRKGEPVTIKGDGVTDLGQLKITTND